MIARIDENGTLLIQRRGLWKEMVCPFATMGKDVRPPTFVVTAIASKCGDHCPHFKEETDGSLRLTCGRGTYLDIAEDARPEPTAETLGIPEAHRCSCTVLKDLGDPNWGEDLRACEDYRSVAEYQNLQLLARRNCLVCRGSGIDPDSLPERSHD